MNSAERDTQTDLPASAAPRPLAASTARGVAAILVGAILATLPGGCPIQDIDQSGQPTVDITQIAAGVYRGTLSSRSLCRDSLGTPTNSVATQAIVLELTADSRVILDGEPLGLGTILLTPAGRETISSVFIDKTSITITGLLVQTSGASGTSRRVFSREDAQSLTVDSTADLSAATGVNCSVRATGTLTQ